MKLSHGFLKNFIDKSLILNLRNKVDIFLDSEETIVNYYPELEKKIPEVNQILKKDLIKKISKYLSTPKPILKAIELHVQLANCEPIPPHQDNFYHCVYPPNFGLKILIPLSNLNSFNGGLSFLNIPINYNVIDHIPTKIVNFSSAISKEEFLNLNIHKTSYNYEIGDLSFHFLNSIHFSHGNKSNKRESFIVFRFENPKAYQNKIALEKYKICSEKHKKLIEDSVFNKN